MKADFNNEICLDLSFPGGNKIIISFIFIPHQLGNLTVQKSFYHFFKTNSNAHHFFKKLWKRFQKEIDDQAQLAISNLRFQNAQGDTGTSKETESKDKQKESKETEEICKFLELLQLLAENHNEDLQVSLTIRSNDGNVTLEFDESIG